MYNKCPECGSENITINKRSDVTIGDFCVDIYMDNCEDCYWIGEVYE
jgi:hypothetical protein